MINKLDEVIDYITNSKDYKDCLRIKNQMKNNKPLMELIDKIKTLQKIYVNSNDSSVLNELEKQEKELNNFPIYVSYMGYLDNVNLMIDVVKDGLNCYFDDLLNKDFV